MSEIHGQTPHHTQPIRSVSVVATSKWLGTSRSTLYEILKKDPTFPRPFKLGHRTFFVESELEAWLQSKVEESRI